MRWSPAHDERVRELERLAADGDERARLQLENERLRGGLPAVWWLVMEANESKLHLVHEPTEGELSTATFPLCSTSIPGRRPRWTTWGQDARECGNCRKKLVALAKKPEQLRALRQRHLELGARLLDRPGP